MSLVLDTSATMAWLYPERTTPAVDQVFLRIELAGAWVPELWRLEVANVLRSGMRRKRHDAFFRDAALLDLALLPIQVDLQVNAHAWNSTIRLSDQHSLTLYDAAYLDLAIRRALPLATLDGELRKAAEAEGVALLGI